MTLKQMTAGNLKRTGTSVGQASRTYGFPGHPDRIHNYRVLTLPELDSQSLNYILGG